MSNIIDSIRLSGTTYQIQGEITVDAALDSGSTNPVANSAITTALDDKVNVADNEVPDYNVTNEIVYQGGYPSQSETASTWDDASMFTLRYNYIRISDVNYTTTAAVIDPSNNIITGRVTVEESIRNPLPDYIDMSFSLDDNAYRFTAKEGYRIAHLDIYNDKWATWGYIREERVDTVFEGGQSADVIKDVIEPTLINKQDQLVSGTNIKTINNQSILGSGNIDIQGGSSYTAGRGISIANNAISVSLPISAGTGTNSIIEGQGTVASGNYGSHAEGWASSATSEASHAEGRETKASGYYSHAEGDSTTARGRNSHAEGDYTTAAGMYSHAEGSDTIASGESSHSEGDSTIANGDYSHTEGYQTTANNQSEHASGRFNVSSSASTTFGNSGNTLFSVGNGTADLARHNAFEIRQNGDIYLTKDGQDVKLQDQLGGSSYTAGNGIDITNDVISVTGKVDTSTYNTYTAATDTALASKADTATTYTKTEVDTALASKADTATTYTKTEVDTALASKQTTLTAGTNITIVDNVISAEGGGKAIEAGRGISITTGETADTVSFDLPISATTNGSILIGVSCSANRDKSFVGGQGSVGQGEGSFVFGQVCKASQWSIAVGDHIEANIIPNSAAFGKYNKQNGGYYEAESATTLFSIGNGTAVNARHNAFEIRQNGDIYLTLDGQDVKLQDQLGGGGSSYTAGDGIDITNDVISVTGKVDTSAITTSVTSSSTDAQVPSAKAVNDKLGGLSLVKLTQSAYDALSPDYDANTLYLIVN